MFRNKRIVFAIVALIIVFVLILGNFSMVSARHGGGSAGNSSGSTGNPGGNWGGIMPGQGNGFTTPPGWSGPPGGPP